MESLIIVVVASTIISIILSKVSNLYDWRKKVEKHIYDKPYLRSIPWIMIGGFIISTYILPSLGFGLGVMITIQVLVVSVAMFLMDLFKV